MPTNLTTWFEFAMQQMAAESYLDGINLQDDDLVGLRLIVEETVSGTVF